MNKRRDRSTDTMLERILNEGDEEKGRHQRFRKFRDGIIANVHILRIADPHEADRVVDGFSLAPEGNETPFAIIEDIAHIIEIIVFFISLILRLNFFFDTICKN